jgi:hypothetical protein
MTDTTHESKCENVNVKQRLASFGREKEKQNNATSYAIPDQRGKSIEDRGVDVPPTIMRKDIQSSQTMQNDKSGGHVIVEGPLKVHLKTTRDKTSSLFILGKKKYYVVVNSEKPALEIYTYTRDFSISTYHPHTRTYIPT